MTINVCAARRFHPIGKRFSSRVRLNFMLNKSLSCAQKPALIHLKLKFCFKPSDQPL